jgi:hypothetical protein
MKILTNENMAFDLNQLPERIDDIRYCVLDYSDPQSIDYYWFPLVFLDIFSSPCADIRIGPYSIQMPLDWSIVIGDKHCGDLEVIRLIDLNDKDFDAFSINPIKGYMPDFFKIEIMNVFADVKWYFPRLKNGHLLALPLCGGENPPCVFFVKEASKIPEALDIRHMV